MKRLKRFFSLVKFGIIFGNSLPLVAGFFLAGGLVSNLPQVLIFGWLIMASGCVLNNCYDADIDLLMQRTKNRPLPQKEFPIWLAFIFGVTLFIASVIWGSIFLNKLTVLTGIFGFFAYVIIYTIFTKRKTGFGVHFGSISGAIPPAIGYLSVSNYIELPAILLFLSLIFWQMPHSFAIEIFRFKDYSNAKIKTVANSKGIKWVKFSIISYIALFFACHIALFWHTSWLHIATSTVLCFWWIYTAIKGFKLPNTFEESKKWARKTFFISIAVMSFISLSLIFSQ